MAINAQICAKFDGLVLDDTETCSFDIAKEKLLKGTTFPKQHHNLFAGSSFKGS